MMRMPDGGMIRPVGAEASCELLVVACCLLLGQHNAADCDGSCYCGAGQRAEHGVAHDVGVRQTAGDTAYKGLCKVDESLCDTAGVHQNAGEDEERNGQQREAVDAGNHLLARNEGGQVNRQSCGNSYQRGNDQADRNRDAQCEHQEKAGQQEQADL